MGRRTRATEDAGLADATAAPRRKARSPRPLVVVESTEKARTLRHCLGRAYTVRTCPAHLKELPEGRLGADPERDLEAQDVLLPGRAPAVAALREAAATTDRVLLAFDPDREDLAWHLAEELQHAGVARVRCEALVPAAVQEAFARPEPLDRHRAEAQRARRLLERLFSDPLEALLGRRVRRGLSVGRTPALVLEMLAALAAQPEPPGESWALEAALEGEGGATQRVWLVGESGAAVPGGREAAELLARRVSGARVWPEPPPPTDAPTASSADGGARRDARSLDARSLDTHALDTHALDTAGLLCLAWEALGLAPHRVLALAGRLYEGVALGEEGHVGLLHFPRALPGGLTRIRPTPAAPPPEVVGPALEAAGGAELARLYALVWDEVSRRGARPTRRVRVELPGETLVFRVERGWAGFLRPLTPLREGAGAGLHLREVQCVPGPLPTAPGEGPLLAALAAQGLARPEALAAALGRLHERRLVEERHGALQLTAAGAACAALLREHVPGPLEGAGAVALEAALREVERGVRGAAEVVRGFWGPFAEALARVEAEGREAHRGATPTDVRCERCGSPMVVRLAKAGPYLACSAAPECKATRELHQVDGRILPVEEVVTDERCEQCGRPMRVREGRHGKFLACTGYPECRGARPIPIGVACPGCREGAVTERRSRRGKVFFGCSRYPECHFVAWDRPLGEPCPVCASPYLVQKVPRREPPHAACPVPGCGFRKELSPPAPPPVPSGEPDASAEG